MNDEDKRKLEEYYHSVFFWVIENIDSEDPKSKLAAQALNCYLREIDPFKPLRQPKGKPNHRPTNPFEINLLTYHIAYTESVTYAANELNIDRKTVRDRIKKIHPNYNWLMENESCIRRNIFRQSAKNVFDAYQKRINELQAKRIKKDGE